MAKMTDTDVTIEYPCEGDQAQAEFMDAVLDAVVEHAAAIAHGPSARADADTVWLTFTVESLSPHEAEQRAQIIVNQVRELLDANPAGVRLAAAAPVR